MVKSLIQRFGTLRVVIPDQVKAGRILNYHQGIFVVMERVYALFGHLLLNVGVTIQCICLSMMKVLR